MNVVCKLLGIWCSAIAPNGAVYHSGDEVPANIVAMAHCKVDGTWIFGTDVQVIGHHVERIDPDNWSFDSIIIIIGAENCEVPADILNPLDYNGLIKKGG